MPQIFTTGSYFGNSLFQTSDTLEETDSFDGGDGETQATLSRLNEMLRMDSTSVTAAPAPDVSTADAPSVSESADREVAGSVEPGSLSLEEIDQKSDADGRAADKQPDAAVASLTDTPGSESESTPSSQDAAQSEVAVIGESSETAVTFPEGHSEEEATDISDTSELFLPESLVATVAATPRSDSSIPETSETLDGLDGLWQAPDDADAAPTPSGVGLDSSSPAVGSEVESQSALSEALDAAGASVAPASDVGSTNDAPSNGATPSGSPPQPIPGASAALYDAIAEARREAERQLAAAVERIRKEAAAQHAAELARVRLEADTRVQQAEERSQQEIERVRQEAASAHAAELERVTAASTQARQQALEEARASVEAESAKSREEMERQHAADLERAREVVLKSFESLTTKILQG